MYDEIVICKKCRIEGRLTPVEADKSYPEYVVCSIHGKIPLPLPQGICRNND